MLPSTAGVLLDLTLTLTTEGVTRSATDPNASSSAWSIALPSGALEADPDCAVADEEASQSAASSVPAITSRFRMAVMPSSGAAILRFRRVPRQRRPERHFEDTPGAVSDRGGTPPSEPGHPDDVASCLEQRHAVALPSGHARVDHEGLEPPVVGATEGREAVAAPPAAHMQVRRQEVRIKCRPGRLAGRRIGCGPLEAARVEHQADFGQQELARHGKFVGAERGQPSVAYPQPPAAPLDRQATRPQLATARAGGEQAAKRLLRVAAQGARMAEISRGLAHRLRRGLARQPCQVRNAQDPARRAAPAEPRKLPSGAALEII